MTRSGCKEYSESRFWRELRELGGGRGMWGRGNKRRVASSFCSLSSMFMNAAEVDRIRLGGENGLNDLRDAVADDGLEEAARVCRNRIGGSRGRSFEI